MNEAMLLAAELLLCAVPFLLIASALAGRSAVSALTVRLGLSQQAAADVGHLFTSSSATSNAITGLASVFFILGGTAAATAVERLYQRCSAWIPRGPRDTLRAVMWQALALAVGWAALDTAAGPGAPRQLSGPVVACQHPRVHRLVVVPASRPGLLAEALPVRRHHQCVLAEHVRGLLGHLLRHGHQL